MNFKTKQIIGWVLTGMFVLMLVASAAGKIRSTARAQAMTASFGIAPDTYRILGVIELVSVVLFAIPEPP